MKIYLNEIFKLGTIIVYHKSFKTVKYSYILNYNNFIQKCMFMNGFLV
jgi:hypothetical protein